MHPFVVVSFASLADARRGVADSLLKDFCAHVAAATPASQHWITANEGNAIALGVGHYMATERVACVYMQNSGFGNCVNPLLSIADPACYGVPLLLVVGWRGEPGTKDEPQHAKQGAVQCALMQAMQLPFVVLSAELATAHAQLRTALAVARAERCAYALLVRADTFDDAPSSSSSSSLSSTSTSSTPALPPLAVNRERAVELLVAQVGRLRAVRDA